MVFDVDSILFADTLKDVTSNPNLVAGSSGALSKDLEFPLSLCYLGINPFMIDTGVKADIEMFLNNGTGKVTHVFVSYAAVIFALRIGVSCFGPPKRLAVLEEEIFLFETDPQTRIVWDGSARVGGMRVAARQHHLAHHKEAVEAGRVGVETHGLQDTVRVTSISLKSGASVESPLWEVREREIIRISVNDLGFATQVCDGLVAVKPEVFKFEFSHVN
jgi:hypothetical protein